VERRRFFKPNSALHWRPLTPASTSPDEAQEKEGPNPRVHAGQGWGQRRVTVVAMPSRVTRRGRLYIVCPLRARYSAASFGFLLRT
jgi:hypothetical protein